MKLDIFYQTNEVKQVCKPRIATHLVVIQQKEIPTTRPDNKIPDKKKQIIQ